MKWLVLVVMTTAAIPSCQNNGTSAKQEGFPTQKEVNRSMEDINRQLALEEDAVIQGFVERRGWEMTKTGTGLRYMIYEQGPEGPKAKDGQAATVLYEVSLIDGTVIYSSKEDGQRSFLIGQDNVESGIHEAITYMKVGDKAKVVLPSHLAHGLTGDNDKIPPRSTVIYDLELLRLQ